MDETKEMEDWERCLRNLKEIGDKLVELGEQVKDFNKGRAINILRTDVGRRQTHDFGREFYWQ